MFGSLGALLISRYFFKNWIKTSVDKKPWFKKHFAAMDAILKENGIKSMLLIRLSFFPFGASSYFFGITGINPLHYFIGSFSFVIKLAMSVFLGCQLFVIGEKEETTTSEKVIFGL